MKSFLVNDAPDWRRRVLLAMVTGLPILIVRAFEDPFNVPKLALLLIGVTFVAVLRIAELLQGSDREGLKRLLFPALAMAVPLLIAWLASDYKVWALWGDHGRFQGLLPYLAMILFGVLLADAFPGRAEQLAWAFTIAAVGVGVYALMQVLHIDPLTWVLDGKPSDRALSTIGNPNFTGGFLGIALPIAVGLGLWDPERRAWAFSAAAVMLGGLIASKSYGGFAAAAGGLSLAGGIWLSSRWAITRLLGMLAAAVVASVVLGAVIFGIAQPENKVVPASIQQRAGAWVAAARMYKESPLVGRGPNVFAFEGIRYRPLYDAKRFTFEFPDDPHFVFLAWLANAGTLGGLGFLAAIGWGIWRGLTAENWSLLTSSFLGALVAYFIQSLVSLDEISLRVGLWVPLAGIVCSLESLPRRVAKTKKGRGHTGGGRKVRAWPALVLLGVAFVAVLVWTTRFMNADAKVLEGSRAFKSGDPEEADELFREALEFRNENSYRKDHILGLMEYALKRQEDGESEELVQSALDSYEELAVPDPITIAAFGRYLYSYGFGDPNAWEFARSLYQKSLRYDPANPLESVGLADIHVALGDPDEALEVLEAYRPNATPADADYWGAVALAQAHLGNEAAARDAAEVALTEDHDDSRALAALRLLEGEEATEEQKPSKP